MAFRSIGTAMLACLLAACTGCCCFNPCAAGAAGPYGPPAAGCNSCASPGFHAPVHSAEVASGCADGNCNGCNEGWRLWHFVGWLGAHKDGCHQGCGDVYVGEYPSDPPRDCDPCDHHGNWTGKPGPYATRPPLRAPYYTPGAAHSPMIEGELAEPYLGEMPVEGEILYEGEMPYTGTLPPPRVVGPITVTEKPAEPKSVTKAPRLIPASATKPQSTAWRPRRQ